MFDRFRNDGRRAMDDARAAALALGHDYIGTEHMLIGLCRNPDNHACALLVMLGLDPARVAAATMEAVTPGTATATGQLPFTPHSKRVLELAMATASEREQDFVGTEHLLFGVVREPRGAGGKVLRRLGVKTTGAGTALELVRERDERS